MKTLPEDERKAIYAVFGKGTVKDIVRYAAKLAPTTPLKGALEFIISSGLGGGAHEALTNFSDWLSPTSSGSGMAALAAGMGTLGGGLAAKGADYALTKRAANTAEAVTRGAKPPGSRAGLSTQEMLISHEQAKEEKNRDYSGKPGPLTLEVTRPNNIDEINKWRVEQGLAPLVDKPYERPKAPETSEPPFSALSKGFMGQ
jgi:hypothetical protein